MLNLTTIYTKEDEGGYTVQVLELPWCVSYGETMEEAEEMIKEAALWWLEAQKKIWRTPKDFLSKNTFIASMSMSYETI